MDSIKSLDQFISQLYRQAPQVPLPEFAQWALDLLQQLIPFDGAVWATGHVESQQFHTHTTVDVSPDILQKLTEYLDINPIFPALIAHQGNAIDMADVYRDQDFYRSPLYRQCFKPFGIERILSSIHGDEDSGIFTLLTLYRYERGQMFSEQEKQDQNRVLYHLLSASSYRQFLALKENSDSLQCALCDAKGLYHAVEPNFIALLNEQLGEQVKQRLPMPIRPHNCRYSLGNLQVHQQQLGELYRISLRAKNPLDQLSARERQVVDGLCQGKTFKLIAKSLQLSPSTVSNHLYRIYLKLGINSRSELVALARQHELP